MIKLAEYFMGRDKTHASELTPEITACAVDLLSKVNVVINYYCDDTGAVAPGVRSGWRPFSINSKVPHASKKSKHINGDAVDVSDSQHRFSNWCLRNLEILEDNGLYMESPEFTPTWCHLQRIPPASGHTVFIP